MGACTVLDSVPATTTNVPASSFLTTGTLYIFSNLVLKAYRSDHPISKQWLPSAQQSSSQINFMAITANLDESKVA